MSQQLEPVVDGIIQVMGATLGPIIINSGAIAAEAESGEMPGRLAEIERGAEIVRQRRFMAARKAQEARKYKRLRDKYPYGCTLDPRDFVHCYADAYDEERYELARAGVTILQPGEILCENGGGI